MINTVSDISFSLILALFIYTGYKNGIFISLINITGSIVSVTILLIISPMIILHLKKNFQIEEYYLFFITAIILPIISNIFSVFVVNPGIIEYFKEFQGNKVYYILGSIASILNATLIFNYFIFCYNMSFIKNIDSSSSFYGVISEPTQTIYKNIAISSVLSGVQTISENQNLKNEQVHSEHSIVFVEEIKKNIQLTNQEVEFLINIIDSCDISQIDEIELLLERMNQNSLLSSTEKVRFFNLIMKIALKKDDIVLSDSSKNFIIKMFNSSFLEQISLQELTEEA